MRQRASGSPERRYRAAASWAAVVLHRFCVGIGSAREQTTAAVDFTAGSKAPEGWRSPRPGGLPLAPSLGKRLGIWHPHPTTACRKDKRLRYGAWFGPGEAWRSLVLPRFQVQDFDSGGQGGGFHVEQFGRAVRAEHFAPTLFQCRLDVFTLLSFPVVAGENRRFRDPC